MDQALTQTTAIAGDIAQGKKRSPSPDSPPVSRSPTKTEVTGSFPPTAAGDIVSPPAGKVFSEFTIAGDSDLTAGNIKSGVNIFGITGTHEGRSPMQSKPATPRTANKIITPDSGYTLSWVAVKGDANLTAVNIKAGSSIFGVSGSVSPALPGKPCYVTPSAAQQVIRPNTGKSISSVTVYGNTDLNPGNIKSGVDIFSVIGTLVAEGGAGIQVAWGQENFYSTRLNILDFSFRPMAAISYAVASELHMPIFNAVINKPDLSSNITSYIL